VQWSRAAISLRVDVRKETTEDCVGGLVHLQKRGGLRQEFTVIPQLQLSVHGLTGLARDFELAPKARRLQALASALSEADYRKLLCEGTCVRQRCVAKILSLQ